VLLSAATCFFCSSKKKKDQLQRRWRRSVLSLPLASLQHPLSPGTLKLAPRTEQERGTRGMAGILTDSLKIKSESEIAKIENSVLQTASRLSLEGTSVVHLTNKCHFKHSFILALLLMIFYNKLVRL